MPKNLIYLSKNKIGDIDGILPVLMEIKAFYPKTNFTIYFYSNKNLKVIKDNYVIWNAAQSLGARVYVIRANNSFGTLLNLIKFILKFSFRNNIVIREGDVLPLHTTVMGILRRFSKVKEIKAYMSIPSPLFAKNIYITEIVTKKRAKKIERQDFMKESDDYFLSSLNRTQLKEYLNIDVPQHKMIKAGYNRKLPEWQRYIQKAINENKVINSNYFLYILSYTKRRCNYFDEPEMIELVEESLDVLKRYNNKIKTIFKPHQKTEVARVKELLERIGYSNYVIDYSHPFVLSSKAKFVFGNVYSCIMFDAYYQGKPVVEYCQYDPEFFAKFGGESFGGGRFCDFFIHRDKKKLEEVIDKLVNDRVQVTRDPNFVKESFPDTPPEFYEFWHKLLA